MAGPTKAARFRGSPRARESGSNDLTLALTGQAIGFSAGLLASATALNLTGQASSYSAGVIAPAIAVSLSGQAATFSAGTLTPSLAVTLNGQSAAFSSGVIVPALAVNLTGQLASFSAGTITAQSGGDLTLALTGQTITFSAGLLIASNDGQSQGAGRSRKIRNIYRITIDGQVFECASLAEALELLDRARVLAQQLAQEQVRKATESPAVELKLDPPKIEANTREIRGAVTETKREIAEIYRKALIDAEIAMLFELNQRAEDDDETILFLL